jgi:hypothetical protein
MQRNLWKTIKADGNDRCNDADGIGATFVYFLERRVCRGEPSYAEFFSARVSGWAERKVEGENVAIEYCWGIIG